MTKVVKFVQNNCTPCKMLDQMLPALGEEVDEVIVIDDSNREEIREKFQVMSTPTLIAFYGEQEITRVSGVGFSKLQDFFSKC